MFTISPSASEASDGKILLWRADRGSRGAHLAGFAGSPPIALPAMRDEKGRRLFRPAGGPRRRRSHELGLIGTVGEAALMHFRGNFQNPAMYLPKRCRHQRRLAGGPPSILQSDKHCSANLARRHLAAGRARSRLPLLRRFERHGRWRMARKRNRWSPHPRSSELFGAIARRPSRPDHDR